MMPYSETIAANGLRFHCRLAGDPSRPLLLFLHGFPEYSGAWEELQERLSDAFFCVAPDQRGYGFSSKPEGVGSYATGKLAADAAAILTHYAPVETGRARAVVGHDWGASVAYALAFSRPDLMERLVVMNGAHPIPFQRALAAGGAQSVASQYIDELRAEDAEARLGAAASENGAGSLIERFSKADWLTGPRREAYADALAQPGALTAMLNWYRATPLKVADPGAPIPQEDLIAFDPEKMRVKPPHLLIWGMKDTALLPEATDGLEALCDDLTRREIADADHWLNHQKPDEVAGMIRDFVS